MIRLKIIVVLLALFAFMSSAFVLGIKASDVEDVSISSVDAVEQAVAEAYKAVWEAEEAGANVSSLLTRLNVAVNYLAKALVASRKEDSAAVTDNANRGIEIADEVRADAIELKKATPQQSHQRLLFSAMQSMIAIGGITVGSIVSWRVFKSRFSKRLSEKRSEVNEHGAERIS